HTQVWDATAQFGRPESAYVTQVPTVDVSRHMQAIDPVDCAFVLAFKSLYLGAEISNQYVSDYVNRNSQKLIGFAGIDPTDHDALEELRIAHEELGLKGATLSPPMQNYHPSDTRAMRVYEECLRRGMPIVFNQDHFNSAARMDFGKPVQLDEVAREFPDLKIVVAHMGFPWVSETIVLLAKHKHVFADIAGLLRHPWQAYTALLSAYEYGVMDKLLFGSNFPYRSPAACIEALYSINQISAGTNLQTIPREQLRGIVERDALNLLGIRDGRARMKPAGIGVFEHVE
ncbi:MAG: amidohydrolase family protein, partial [Phycisphaerae bacterium]